MNILTFDIEEWYIEKIFNGGRRDKYQEYDSYLKAILDLLDQTNTTATFFCLGKIASYFPDVIKTISNRGHEIGCHSNEHLWLSKMTPTQLKNDTYNALAALQDVVGKKVISYRAPAFSISEGNKWAFEILAQEGIEMDASVFPTVRDFGGFNSFPTDSPVIISYNGTTIKEFPICLTKFAGKEFAYSGGGYFRFFPYNFIQNRLNLSEYVMSYFHIGDLLLNKGGLMSRSEYESYFKENGSLKNRLFRYIKSNLGTKGAFDKMSKLIINNDYLSISSAADSIDWFNSRIIKF